MNLWKHLKKIGSLKFSGGGGTKNKSYRRKYMYYYALTFIVPILLVFLVNIYSSQIIKKQTLQSNQKVLKQFFNLVEAELDSMIGNAYLLACRHEVFEFSEWLEQEMNMDYLNTKTELLEKIRSFDTNGRYHDMFLWYADSDAVVSGMKPATDSIGIEEYCSMYYDREGIMSSNIREALEGGRLNLSLWPMVKDGGPQNFAIAVSRIASTSKLKKYELVLVVDSTFIEAYIGEAVLAKGEDALLFNKEGELLYSHLGTGIEYLEEEYRGNGVYDIKTNGKKSVFLVQESKCMEGYYAIEIPYAMFYHDLYIVRNISWLGIFISIVIGILVTRRMSRNTYKPLEQILQRFQEKIDWQYEPQEKSEFDFLAEVIEQKDKERANAQIEAREKKADRRKKLLLIALEGKEMSNAETEFLEKKVTLARYFYGGIFKVKNQGKIGWELMSFVIANVFEELLQEKGVCDVIPVSFNRFAIVLNQNEEIDEESVLELLQRGIDFFEQHMEVYVQLGMGDACEGLYELCNMYRQSQYALEYHFLKDKETIIRYRDVQDRRIETPFWSESPMYHMMNEFMNREKTAKEDAKVLLTAVIQKYGIKEDSAVETLIYFKYEVLKVLNALWTDCDMGWFTIQSYTQQLTDADSYEKYTECLAEIVVETAHETRKRKRKNLLAEQVKAYVDQNYKDANLSVSAIGDVFGMQAAYLSRIFREEYGVLILNYISGLRIEYAQKMLTETGLSVNEIAEAAGFLSGDVFIKTFKKIIGVTPGKYRAANTRTINSPEK